MPKDDQQKQEKAKKSRKAKPKKEKGDKSIFDNYNNGQIDKELLEIIEDSDEEFDMFFSKPEQLEDLFSFLEEKNLLLINTTKERE